MRKILLTILLLCQLPTFAQFYIRGEVTDERGKPLANVNIKVHSTGLTYKSGYDGSFGLPSNRQPDSLFFTFDGYEKLAKQVTAKLYVKASLKKIETGKSIFKNDLHSFIINSNEKLRYWTYYNETYTSLVENPFVSPDSFPLTYFSANTNRASYTNVRRFLNEQEQPPPDAVRIEEMLNYFNFNYQKPDGKELFQFSSTLTTCPWNKKNQLLFMNLSTRTVVTEHVPPNNFVFLIDVSGSMDVPKKLPLLKAGLRLLLKNLRPVDTISLVTYGGMVRTVLEAVSGAEKEKMIRAIDGLAADGDTPGEEAIKLAYQIAKRYYNKNANNRIILATDGDFNIGSSSEKDLAQLIEQHKNVGIYLTCLGVGMGNYKDSKLSVLAQRGKGNFAYIDNEQEAEKVLLTEFTQTLYTVADNVYFTIQMNSDRVKDYRLIGFDNKRTLMADSTSRIKGGELGAGRSSMAIFEIVPAGNSGKNPMALAEIHYNIPGDEVASVTNFECASTLIPFDKIPVDLQRAACVTWFGLKLKLSTYIPRVSWKNVELLSQKYFRKDVQAEQEFLNLVSSARKAYRKKGWLHLF